MKTNCTRLKQSLIFSAISIGLACGSQNAGDSQSNSTPEGSSQSVSPTSTLVNLVPDQVLGMDTEEQAVEILVGGTVIALVSAATIACIVAKMKNKACIGTLNRWSKIEADNIDDVTVEWLQEMARKRPNSPISKRLFDLLIEDKKPAVIEELLLNSKLESGALDEFLTKDNVEDILNIAGHKAWMKMIETGKLPMEKSAFMKSDIKDKIVEQLKADPMDSTEVWYWINKQVRPDELIRLDTAIQKKPSNIELRKQRIKFLKEQKVTWDKDMTVADLKRLLEFEEIDENRLDLAEAYLMVGNPKLAREEMNKLSLRPTAKIAKTGEVEPPPATPLTSRRSLVDAKVLIAEGQNDSVILERLERAINNANNNDVLFEALMTRVTRYIRLKNKKLALADIERAADIKPGHASVAQYRPMVDSMEESKITIEIKTPFKKPKGLIERLKRGADWLEEQLVENSDF